MAVRCPNCLEDETTLVSRETLDPGVKRSYVCDSCGHTWGVVL